MTAADMRALADSLGRVLVRRTTLYAQNTGDDGMFEIRPLRVQGDPLAGQPA
jgi:hypothetical protein